VLALNLPQEAFQRLKLSHLLSITLDEFLINQHKMDPRFVREFIAAVTRSLLSLSLSLCVYVYLLSRSRGRSVQYGQAPSTLHALVGLVSLVGAEEGSLLSVKGGNRQVRLLRDKPFSLSLSLALSLTLRGDRQDGRGGKGGTSPFQ
jgi:hypothetical protein